MKDWQREGIAAMRDHRRIARLNACPDCGARYNGADYFCPDCSADYIASGHAPYDVARGRLT